MSISPQRFAEFFEAVHGFAPFPWQERLATRVLGIEPHDSGRPWPEALALPTGSGKTACLDVALFALACQADLSPEKRTAPRRIFFVVDRRIIVDEVYEHSLEVAKKLDEALQSSEQGILKEVAAAFQKFSGDPQDVPLACHQLRGGMYRDDAWARTPTQPTVICSTVDQIGSRLLFRTYGRSSRTWPVHAGLAGNDALVLLDEAHCANPFFQTMSWIARYRSQEWASQPLSAPFQFAVMSATPSGDLEDVLRADEADRKHPVLGPRLSASKPTSLIASKAKGGNFHRELAIELVTQAARLVSESRQAIAILVNRVRTAKLVDELLRSIRDETFKSSTFDERTSKKLRKELPARFQSDVLIGRMRPCDQEAVRSGCLKTLKASVSGQRSLQEPLFVVATQCLEVGANLDFDGMVTECASLDALRQRFGRLNRMGRSIDARGVVVIRADQTEAKISDPIYEDSIAETWQWLVARSATTDGTAQIDFGIQPMTRHWDESGSEKLLLAGKNAPIMLPAYMDSLVQTNPVPVPELDVTLFLHGPKDSQPEISICWRSDLPDEPCPEDLAIAAIGLCPPTTLECLSVPLAAFQEWWQSRSVTDVSALSDVDAQGPVEVDDRAHLEDRQRWGIIWRGPTKSVALDWHDRGGRPRPGDTVVLPAGVGGWDELGFVPPTAIRNGIDVAEECQQTARLRSIVRLTPRTLPKWPSNSELERLLGEPEQEIDSVRQVLNSLIEEEKLEPGRLVELAVNRRTRWVEHPLGGVVLIGPQEKPDQLAKYSRPESRYSRPETMTTEDDSSSRDSRPITLKSHSDAVASRAKAFATGCGLPTQLVEAIDLAGRLHDVGKADVRFQAVLHGGNMLVALASGELYAKSAGLVPKGRTKLSWCDPLPDGFRHELVSLSLVEAAECRSPGALIPHGIDRDLVLHLIAAHHGQCRPFADVITDDHPPAIDVSKCNVKIGVSTADERREWTPPHALASGTAERFWRLVRRYGWWGLAWMEAMFILADHRQSEAEAEERK